MPEYRYDVRQAGASVTIKGDNDAAMRDKAHRIARKSLETGEGEVEITRIVRKQKPRVVAILSDKSEQERKMLERLEGRIG